MADVMRVRILADGTIKTETDPISGPNHQSAEQFLRDVQQLTGGATSRKARHGHVHHVHQQDHDHQHEH